MVKIMKIVTSRLIQMAPQPVSYREFSVGWWAWGNNTPCDEVGTRITKIEPIPGDPTVGQPTGYYVTLDNRQHIEVYDVVEVLTEEELMAELPAAEVEDASDPA